jgi:hypothetical protein
MKETLLKLIEELNALIGSGVLSPEDETKFVDAKKHAERALDAYELMDDVKFTILILEVIKLLGGFFLG